jgi:leucyl-tRNA synthetase
LAQRNWIGKKEGIDIEYEVEGIGEKVICWTSRLDTNFGATFVVLAPEHPLAIKLTTDENRQKVSEYIKISQKKNNKEKRIREEREKTGVFTGSFAINNLNDYKMPIWISDFVLAGIGTGAVVGVPGHDRRDFEFAQKYKIPIVRVVVGSDEDKSDITKIEQVQEEEGKMINSQLLNGMDIRKATEKMMNYMEEKGWGKQKTTYHLRDWLISRQRYWGPPIPMIYCESCAKSGKSYFSERGSSLLHEDQSGWENAGWYPEENLPVELPYYEDYKPKGGGTGPLDDHPDFYETSCPKCGGEAKRETDVSDTFLDSAWYFLRYPSVGSETCSNKAFDPTITEKWLPVDIYFGGAEHAVLHLMYARFIWHVLRDMGYLDFSSHGQPPSGWDEPFPDFFAHGLVIKDGVKMSKSRGNTVNPDEYIEKFGADTLRLYLMFMGPMDGYPDFRDTGIEGMRRFIDRVWSLFNEHLDIVVVEKDDKKKILIKMHQTINKVTKDIEKFRYNTAISSIMEYVNLLRDIALRSKKADEKTKRVEWEDALKTLALVLAPFTPHMAEEVWVERLNRKYSIHKTAWPGFDKNLIREKALTIIVQVNGKLRATITVDNDKANDEKFVTNLARRNEKISPWLEKGVTSDAIFVPGKLVNFVVV